MPARIIHVGKDLCHRLAVLENAGFLVHECASITDLREAFRSNAQPDAALFVNDESQLAQQVLAEMRHDGGISLILFGEALGNLTESDFHLIIPNLEPPALWLAEITALIARSQARGGRAIKPVERDPGAESSPAQRKQNLH